MKQLRLNRIQHYSLARKLPEYPGDLVINKECITHSICRGAVAIDGAGNTRAYNHLINGSQHSLIVFSLISAKPIMVRYHQTSSQKFSVTLTRMMNEQKVK